ncbi:diguanylate cyclase [Bradyrhizobium sp. AUGA SZCCT0240]|uniref:diguanylate cyclase domain-containing protein n=1 Tax=unclassified Bradyrhizobium TaxID=2631580 RepID=UPI001BABEC28|nr:MULTISPECIES: diguanylate cyclase [unclassified Bradyrhizobium]MBR1196176.1 diguanylate cyclase [Bradyrhizobium sp. AUGA SZCCT0158]MBR1240433.1 diguanylate cyclase [Bradyrhizobium sp. AUGA SZCCT0274]MBR1256106.1 diguanylate cyclase [Bradyrhizobium sp. AUGA SZCCT0240]
MSSVIFNRNRVKLKKLLGIRTRLVLLALMLVAPLMLERVRSLEHARSKQIALATEEFLNIAQHSADTQREVVSSVETMLKSAAYIRASSGIGRSCEILRASLPSNLPWIRSIMIASKDGLVQCSTLNIQVGLQIGDREYFKKAQASRDFVFSDYLFGKTNGRPMMMAAYPVSAINPEEDAIVVAGINIDWLSKIMTNLGGRPGISSLLVDSAGVVLAAPTDQTSMIGRPLDSVPLMSAVAEKALSSDAPTGSLSFTASDGSNRTISFSRISGTQSRLIVSIDETRVTAAINREIRTAYLQLGFVCLFVLLGALIGAEKLIINPIEVMTGMARRFGEGDRTARVARSKLPSEFMPLARAFNAMAAQLSQRERELLANNDRLTVIASIDMLSGLANRRGFQSRLDFEWMKAQQYNSELSLLMIDVDHFKLYNDTYGHPEGDACLTRLGETLAGIAADTMGFAGRYGGEEFCLLLPNTDSLKALAIGEMVRTAVLDLKIPHHTSSHHTVTVSIGVAGTLPNDAQRPGDLIEAADAALYAAKHRGRNTVVEHGFAKMVDQAGMALAG